MPLTVAELDETELIARFAPRLPRGARTPVGTGDDAAVLRFDRGDAVVTTDVLVEDHHFRRRWSSGADVGWRAAMQNLADVAAMGALPRSLVVSLVMPPDLPVDWVIDLADGLAQACAPHDVGVVGGDLSAGPSVMVSVTALGELDGVAPVLRSGARAGDQVALAGTLGRAAAGYALLELADSGVVLPGSVEGLMGAFRRPTPPLGAGVEAARSGATAMLDLSDGLLRDAGRVARASGVGIELSSRLLGPEAEALQEAAEIAGIAEMDWVLGGGEDHGLLATFPVSTALPAEFRRIGSVVEVSGDVGAGASGSVALDGVAPRVRVGWDHFGG